MIGVPELRELQTEWQLREDVIEKDYVLGWLLAAISVEERLSGWVFKGGTCLRKCYYETYRFSEDLDFTISRGAPEEPAELVEIFADVSGWLHDTSGIELILDEKSFVRKRNKRGNATTLGKIAFRGPRNSPSLAKIKLDLTNDEALVLPVVQREIFHSYSDASSALSLVNCYSIVELLGEKLRALAERCRPRDLYDVIHVYRQPDLVGRAQDVFTALEQKCAHAGIPVPTLETIHNSKFRQEIETEWGNMLAHQLPELPPFDQFWNSLDSLFEWLIGQKSVAPQLARASLGSPDPNWAAPRTMTSWRLGAPLELIRFAGANRLKVEIDYLAENGRQGPRIVEPYSLRMTQDGNVVLFAVNDIGQLCSYRIDRIAGVSVPRESFVPIFLVEF